MVGFFFDGDINYVKIKGIYKGKSVNKREVGRKGCMGGFGAGKVEEEGEKEEEREKKRIMKREEKFRDVEEWGGVG